ncbi:DUF1109 domain-containing protein [Novosphingobium sp.]|uniref:DUF1109 domain-containing protein n=1 Tax=Novosphingobium sp. TaxID=1874826 RepID=UPI003D1211FA
MTAEDLIATLSRDLRPVPRHALLRRVGLGLGLGVLATLIAVGGWLGYRPDLMIAMHGAVFWIKSAYTISLAACATVAMLRLSRPDGRVGGWLVAMLVPVLGLAAIALGELAMTPRADWLAMWLGASWTVCSRNVFLLAVPIFAGLLWSVRRLAPTRLVLAGTVAGMAAGAWGATLYCLHCPETSALFVLTWYTLGMAGMAALGAIMGPRALRW